MDVQEEHFYSLEGIDIPAVIRFHRHFLSRGGWFNYTMLSGTGLDSMYATSFRECNRRISDFPDDIKPPSMNFNFINNLELNAVASTDGSTYFIGIYSGTFIFINDLFLRILSSNKLLRGIGNVSAESETKKIYSIQHFSLNSYSLAKPAMEQLMPNDRSRQLFAIFCTKMALKFLFDHEFAHILFGHVGLANSKGLHSISEKEVGPFSDMDSQSMEMDADSSAAHKAMLDLFLYSTSRDSAPADFHDFTSDFFTGIGNWMFAVYSFYRIFAQNDPPYELLSRSHPPIGLRLRMMFGSLVHTVRRLNPQIEESDLIRLHFDTLIAVEESLTEIAETVRGIGEIELSFSPEGLDHINAVVRNWQLLKAKLTPFTFSPLAD